MTLVSACLDFVLSYFTMAPSDRQWAKLLELVLKCIVPAACAALQIYLILMVVILLQHVIAMRNGDSSAIVNDKMDDRTLNRENGAK